MEWAAQAKRGVKNYKKATRPVRLLYQDRTAQEVCVLGDFNEWEIGAHPMQRLADGSWTAELELEHGHHRYVFYVDGECVLDPNASGLEPVEGGHVCLLAIS